MKSFTPSYPLAEFKRDLEELYTRFPEESADDERTILAYAHATYDSPLVADSRAHALTRALEFITEQGSALVAAGYAEKDEAGFAIEERALAALWAYVGMLPGLAPRPELEKVLSLLSSQAHGA